MSALRAVKKALQRAIDGWLVHRAKTQRADVPADVLHRKKVLKEEAIKNARKRISLVRRSLDRAKASVGVQPRVNVVGADDRAPVGDLGAAHGRREH